MGLQVFFSGNVSDLRLVDGEVRTQSVLVLKDTDCTTAGVC